MRLHDPGPRGHVSSQLAAGTAADNDSRTMTNATDLGLNDRHRAGVDGT